VLLVVFASGLLAMISNLVHLAGWSKPGIGVPSIVSPAPVGAITKGPSSATIENGSFTDGDKLPTGWGNLPWIGQGQAHLTRDTTVFKSAPASLCLEGTTVSTYTALDHLLAGYQPGQRFRIRGWMRAEGTLKEASVAIRGREVMDPIGQQKEYVFLNDAHNSTEWVPFERDVTLSQGSKYAYFVMVVAGQGKLWVDDLSITPLP
jgi:hypothetical protein